MYKENETFLLENKMEKTAKKTAVKVVPKTMLTIKQLANTLVNRFNGYTAIDEEKGNKKGMRFATISFHKPMKMRKNHRTAKDENDKKVRNPFLENGVFEVGKIRIDVNAIWENCVNNKADRTNETGNVAFEAKPKRNNGIENYNDSRVVCHKIKDAIETFYLNYIVAEYIGETTYEDKDGNALDYADLAEYHQTKSVASKQKEADKHGLDIENDVQIRQMKIENISQLAIFGVHYVPTESATVIVDNKTPVSAVGV